MAIQLTIPQILSIAQVSQYLTVVDSRKQTVRKGGDLNQKQARLIYMERMAVQRRYSQNPGDPTLTATGNYLFSLLRNWPAAQNIINAIQSGGLVITGPSNASVTVGQNGVFTITVASPTPYTIQWYRDGVLIPGATSLSYTLINAQLTDSGAAFNAVVTNAAGPSSSQTGVLTVTSALQAKWWWGPSDPFPALSGGTDNLSYQITQTITHNAAIIVNYSGQAGAEDNQFNVLRIPSTENDKTAWVNGNLNSGSIPDSVMREILVTGGFKYIISRNAMSLDPVTTTLTYS